MLRAIAFAMATKKHKADEVGEVSAPQECVTMHGGVTEPSPVKHCNPQLFIMWGEAGGDKLISDGWVFGVNVQ